MKHANRQILAPLACNLALAALLVANGAHADPITTIEFPDDFGGPVSCVGTGNDVANLTLNATDCSAAGGFVMSAFGDDPRGAGTTVTSVDSPLGGTMHFLEKDGTDPVADALSMTIGDPSVVIGDPDWWQYNDHSSVYMTTVNWIELHFDMSVAEPVRAFSFFVGASFSGSGWVQGFDQYGNESLQRFNINPGDSPGFAVFGDTGSCSTISRIIVEPNHVWGVGNFSINQDPCTQVPEPGNLGLLGIGLFALGFARRFRRPQLARSRHSA